MGKTYSVQVIARNNQIHVKVDPQPEPVDPSNAGAISEQVQEVIIKWGNVPNSIVSRRNLKKELSNKLEQLQKQGLIRPRKE